MINEGRGSGRRPPSAEVLASLVARMEGMAAGLDGKERAALLAILRQAPSSSALAELGAEPPAEVLRPEELEIYKELREAGSVSQPARHPHLGLIMKATRVCNLRCAYCRSWAEGPDQVMSFEVLARATWGALTAPGVESVELIWHGGEPTLRPISFYRKALWLQQQFRRPGQRIVNNLQTNGTRLRPEWIDFLKRYQFRVGVSLDGPPEIHDTRRLDVAGNPTSERIRAGLAQLREHGVKHGICMVVDDDVLDLGPQRLLEYLIEAGVSRAGLLGVVPQGDPRRASSHDPYLAFPRYIEFLQRLFGLWWPDYVDRISFREIDDLLARLRGEKGSYCYFEPNCMGSFMTIEPQGHIEACDKFQGDGAFRFGNVRESPLLDALGTEGLCRARSETAADRDRNRSCEWFGFCQGGCPHDRHVRRQRENGNSEACCGWAPLISDMAQAVGLGPISPNGSK